MAKGPVGMISVWPKGPINMGKSMGQWVTYVLVISIVVAYVTGRTLGAGASFPAVFRVAGTVASLAYASAIVPSAIWWGRPWSVTWKEVADGIVYGLLTGAELRVALSAVEATARLIPRCCSKIACTVSMVSASAAGLSGR